MTPAVSLLYPMDEFYALAGLPLPAAEAVTIEQIPEVCRNILVHDRDMTPTLEQTYGGAVDLHVLRYALNDGVLARQIVLTLRGDGAAVIFGAIRIYLEHFPPAAKALVSEMKEPLGSVLRSERMEHGSHPAGYFRVPADELIRQALRLEKPATLFGRRNVLVDGEGRTLAQVVEILPPEDRIAGLISR